MNDELQDTLAALAKARALVTETTAKLAAYKLPPAYHALIIASETAKMEQRELDNRARDLALAVYQESKTKNPAPGISVGIGSKITLTYGAQSALDWARTTGLALALDTKAFEKIAEAANLEFVIKTEIETQRVAIASDLTKFYPITETVVEEPEPLFTPGYPQEETDELDT